MQLPLCLVTQGFEKFRHCCCRYLLEQLQLHTSQYTIESGKDQYYMKYLALYKQNDPFLYYIFCFCSWIFLIHWKAMTTDIDLFQKICHASHPFGRVATIANKGQTTRQHANNMRGEFFHAIPYKKQVNPITAFVLHVVFTWSMGPNGGPLMVAR